MKKEKKFFSECLFAYKIRFVVERKIKNQFSKLLSKTFKFFVSFMEIVKNSNQSVQLFSNSRRNGLFFFLLFFENVWNLHDKHFLHTLDVWNCMIKIFVVWNCMINIFDVWRSTRAVTKHNNIKQNQWVRLLHVKNSANSSFSF